MNKAGIFKKGSTTYFYSSVFFPPTIREDVFTLYAFVRTADDYVDTIPQQTQKFLQFKQDTVHAFSGKKIHNQIISDFIQLCRNAGITQEAVFAFFDSMEADTKKTTYKTYKDLQKYIYGSASVIGLMMAKLMRLPKESYYAAQKQGESMQLINFIRDIKEDIALGRTYIPQEDLKRFSLNSVEPKTEEQKKQFKRLIHFELKRYYKTQKEAEKGYKHIPPRYRIPVMTASDMYNWTARQIEKDPLVVFKGKVKPKPIRVILRLLRNYFYV